ncbi:MAG: hypothetical protein ACP5IA_01190 [Sediminispirochaetaceae bacterium]
MLKCGVDPENPEPVLNLQLTGLLKIHHLLWEKGKLPQLIGGKIRSKQRLEGAAGRIFRFGRVEKLVIVIQMQPAEGYFR